MVDDSIPFGLREVSLSKYFDGHKGNFLSYVDESENSNKFWAAIPDVNDKFIIMWGKNGRPPQGTKTVNWYEAQTKFQEKIKKGYRPIHDKERLAKAFMESPEWFEKVNGSLDFTSKVQAKILDKHLDKSLPIPTAKTTKFRI